VHCLFGYKRASAPKVMLMSHLQQSALICSDLLMYLAWIHLGKLCTVSFQLMTQSCLNYNFWI